MVALWFAALMGTGSLVLRPELIEGLIQALRIDTIIPAAAPPLGMTFRLLLALMLGLVGGAIGWAVARRIAGPAPQPKHPVINVAEDFDAETFDSLPWPDERPAEIVPDQPEPAAQSETEQPEASQSEANEVHEFIASDAAAEPVAAPAPDPEQANEASSLRAAPASPTAAERIAGAELATLSHVELIERLAIAIRHRQQHRDGESDAATLPDPVIRFPGQQDRQSARRPTPAVRSPAETERALRQALAQLQHMSGGG